MSDAQNDYNGPDKTQFHDHLADYEEARFNMMRAASLAGKVLNDWEKKGGNKNDIRDGYALRQMNSEEQQAELRRQVRVASWMNLISEDAYSQTNFLKVFDAPPTVEVGIGGAPIGSRLSLGRAMSAGYNDGKTRNGPGLQDGIESYGWVADSEEAMAYSEGWGDGFKLRPPPKAPKEKSLSEAIDEELGQQEPAAGEPDADEAPKPKRGRPKKSEAAASNENVVPLGRGKRAPLALPAPDDDMPDDVDFDERMRPPG